jgi:hypothetical protein
MRLDGLCIIRLIRLDEFLLAMVQRVTSNAFHYAPSDSTSEIPRAG